MSALSASRREQLIEELRTAGISDERVLAAIGQIPRDRFVSRALSSRAYENVALPIGYNQTISQPAVVAHMAQVARLKPTDHVLEVGTGSGYGAAVLARLAQDVVTVEVRPPLALAAARRLRRLGYTNILVVVGDGSLGWPSHAPYDSIIITAATPGLPPVLLDQLSDRGGRLVAPVGSIKEQRLVLAERNGADVESHLLGGVRFVPLVGIAGFDGADGSRRN